MTDLQRTTAAVTGPVHLRVPPDPAMSRVLRLAAGGLASLYDFSIDETEDLKVAVSEALIVLVEHGRGDPIDISIEVEDRHLRIHGSTAIDHFDPQHAGHDLCRLVLDSVCTHHEIVLRDDQLHVYAELGRAG